LASPSPNPSHGSTTLAFTLPMATRVRLTVHDVAGRCVARLVDGPRARGVHLVEWDARDTHGRRTGAGVWLVRLEAGATVRTVRFVRLP
jgi:flagellar hook assembly protein FlgD